MYVTLFSMGKRDGEGERWDRAVKWNPTTALPRLFGEPTLYAWNERRSDVELRESLDRLGWKYEREHKEERDDEEREGAKKGASR